MSTTLNWSDIDKVRFFTIGTFMYSGLTIMLHPATVVKTRQQVLLSSNSTTSAGMAGGKKGVMGHQVSLRNVIRDSLQSSSSRTSTNMNLSSIRGLYRGLGVVLLLAVPARVVYVVSLEGTRDVISNIMTTKPIPSNSSGELLTRRKNGGDIYTESFIASASSGVAGGVAAVSAQMLVVPMDVISQRQMVMCTSYTTNNNSAASSTAKRGDALSIFRSIINSEGWRGVYRGFGISLLTSLPGGAIWWGTYGGCQQWCQHHEFRKWVGVSSSSSSPQHHSSSPEVSLFERGLVQLLSGISAAMVATAFTQPLDVIKTRLQVDTKSEKAGGLGRHSRVFDIAKNLAGSSGIRGFYRGTVPRIIHMSLWGTVLSSAYESLKHVSMKEELLIR